MIATKTGFEPERLLTAKQVERLALVGQNGGMR
jgi:hypothetical protein